MVDTLSSNEERDRKYAWDYFELHSSQRLTTFNFYLTISIAIVAGISAIFQLDNPLPFVTLVLGAILILIAFIFWKLDQRNKMLIKAAEDALKEIEHRIEVHEKNDTSAISLFNSDDIRVRARKSKNSLGFWQNYFSYSDCFNLTFMCFGFLGLFSIVAGFFLK